VKKIRNIQAAVIIIIIVLSAQTSAFTPDKSLINPLFLKEIGNGKLVYGALDPGTGTYTFAYAEYDNYAKGHGALVIEDSRDANTATFSFIGVQSFGAVDLGYAVHKEFRPESKWLADLGAAYNVDKFIGRAAVHGIPLSSLSQAADLSYLSVGASVRLNELITFDLDLLPQRNQLTGTVLLKFSSDLTAGFQLGYKECFWESAGVQLWLKRQQIILHLSYELAKSGDNCFHFGIGLRF